MNKSQGKFVVPARRKKKNPNSTPGPGAYELNTSSKTRNTRAPVSSFGKANMGGRPIASFAGKDSPGPAGYDVWGSTRTGRSTKERWKPNAGSFPSMPNRPSPFKETRSPGPIYWPAVEYSSQHGTTGARWSLERTAHASMFNTSIGPGPVYNVRNGRQGSDVRYIGDVSTVKKPSFSCGTRPIEASDRSADLPGPATYDPPNMDASSGGGLERQPKWTIQKRWGEGSLKVPKEPSPGPKYVTHGPASGSRPTLQNTTTHQSFSKDERFWDEDP